MTDYYYGGYFFLGLLAQAKNVLIQLLKALVWSFWFWRIAKS